MSVGNYTGHNTNFNLSTGVADAPHPPATMWSSKKFTGLDGNIYVLHHGRYYLQVYNSATSTWDTILGSGKNGRCDDGTPALECSSYIMSAFVNEFGKVYFVDMGVIRYIDDFGAVRTIAGQPRNFGVGYPPLLARYSQINFFDISGNDIYVKNKLENQIVKFDLTGGNMSLVAGNSVLGYSSDGDDAATSPLPNCSWSMPCLFKIDPVNNRLYHHNGSTAWYINLADGKWVNQNITMMESSTRSSYLGYNGSELITYIAKSLGGNGNKTLLTEVDPSSSATTDVYGRTDILLGLATNFTAGQVGTESTLAHTQGDFVQMGYQYDPDISSWLVAYKTRNNVFAIPSGGGVVTELDVFAKSISSFDYKKVAGNYIFFYCATDGKLYKRDSALGTEVELTLPVSTIACAGNIVKYHPDRDSLIFIYRENQMFGIGEYKNP